MQDHTQFARSQGAAKHCISQKPADEIAPAELVDWLQPFDILSAPRRYIPRKHRFQSICTRGNGRCGEHNFYSVPARPQGGWLMFWSGPAHGCKPELLAQLSKANVGPCAFPHRNHPPTCHNRFWCLAEGSESTLVCPIVHICSKALASAYVPLQVVLWFCGMCEVARSPQKLIEQYTTRLWARTSRSEVHLRKASRFATCWRD